MLTPANKYGISTLLDNMSPTTLAAMLRDVDDAERYRELADLIREALVYLVGEKEADELFREACRA